MDLNKKTFCAGTWFQIRNDRDNGYRPCCEIDLARTKFQGQVDYRWPDHSPNDFLNSDYLWYLRQQLHEGHRVPECQSCWSKEDSNLKSLRQILNDTATKNRAETIENTWIRPYLNKKTNFEHDLLLSVDIKLSNLCNFSCAMCNPADSTKIYSIWKKDVTHPVVSEFLDTNPRYLIDIKKRYKTNPSYDLLASVLRSAPQHVKILGGEPLMDQQMLRVLQDLPPTKKKQISLLFVTNGSVDLTEFAAQLDGYQQVNYVVSLDGAGPVQDYIRRGSDWHYITQNIQKWNSCHRPVDVCCTLQCLNFLHLPALLDWCSKNQINVNFGIVENPEYLSLSVIPESLRLIIKRKLESRYADLARLIDGFPSRAELLPKLHQFLDWYDPKNDWQSIFPEWKELLLS